MKNVAKHSRISTDASAGYGRKYASPGEFCAIFTEDMDRLYWLALVLTGAHEAAQQCFVSALEECQTESAVFPEWARSWSRRTVIKAAIRMVDPVSSNANQVAELGLEALANEMDSSIHPLLECGRFERFVFVMSVLEGYRTRECAVLLGCGSREVEEARLRVLQRIASTGKSLIQTWHAEAFGAEHDPVLTLQ